MMGLRSFASNIVLSLGTATLSLATLSAAPRPPVQALPSSTTLPAPTTAPSTQPTILIYTNQGYFLAPFASPKNLLDVVAWADGRIVWRANGTLLQGKFDPRKLTDLLLALHRDGVFGTGDTRYASFGPDSAFDVVDIRLPDRRLRLESWHDLFEANPKLVATDRGIEALEGRDRNALLAASSPEYRRFRKTWSDIRATTKSWIPSASTPYTGPALLPRD